MSVKLLRDQVKRREFAPAYLLFGEEEYLKEENLQQLLAAAVDPATKDFNLEIRRGADLDGEALGVLLGTPPMMADRRVVVVRDVTALRKDAHSALERYLAHPASDTVLVLMAAAGAKLDAGITELVVAVEFDPLTGTRVPRWIEHYASQLGVSITDGASTLLQAAVGDELPLLKLELDKLASYTNGAPIDEDAVSAIVGIRREETLGAFLDFVADGDATPALAMIETLLQQPKQTGVSIVMALSTQTLALAWADAKGLAANRLSGELYNLLKEGRAFPGRSWGEAVNAWTKRAPKQDARRLDAALDALVQADAALKETRISSEEQVLSTLVLAMCGQLSPRRSAA
ncbi:MAG: polymerase subunit delta [Gemmatimonadetes bacterium]|nr:polymerase subunit delta [Gemmatimonadota bacterium]